MTGSVIPGNLLAHTDRVPEHPHPKIGTDSGPDDVQNNSTSTPEAALTLPFSFLETGNEKPETRKTNSSKESYPRTSESQAGFSRVQVSARVFTPGRRRMTTRQRHEPDRWATQGDYGASPLRLAPVPSTQAGVQSIHRFVFPAYPMHG